MTLNPPRTEDRLRRVIVIDDNRDAANILVVILSSVAIIRAAYSGPEGIALFKSFEPEVVLLDLEMPGMDGFSVARCLRSSPEGAVCRLIAHTAAPRELVEARAREYGFDDILSKPAEIEEYRKIIGC